MANNYWRERSKPYKVGQTAPFRAETAAIAASTEGYGAVVEIEYLW